MNETNETEKVNGESESSESATSDQHAQEVEADVVDLKSDEKEPADEDLKIKKSVWDALEKERNDFKDKFFYLAAEKENLQKRFEREKESLIKYGNEKSYLTSMSLTILD